MLGEQRSESSRPFLFSEGEKLKKYGDEFFRDLSLFNPKIAGTSVCYLNVDCECLSLQIVHQGLRRRKVSSIKDISIQELVGKICHCKWVTFRIFCWLQLFADSNCNNLQMSKTAMKNVCTMQNNHLI